jgi:hypothetical protein
MDTTTLCPYCGESLLPGASFCRHCGEDLERGKPEWEQPGAVRRDCESHRGGLIGPLTVVGLILSFLHIFAVIGLPICFAALQMSRDDLAKMHAGRMDPEGMASTLFAKRWSVIGLIVGSIWLVVILVVFLLACLNV